MELYDVWSDSFCLTIFGLIVSVLHWINERRMWSIDVTVIPEEGPSQRQLRCVVCRERSHLRRFCSMLVSFGIKRWLYKYLCKLIFNVDYFCEPSSHFCSSTLTLQVLRQNNIPIRDSDKYSFRAKLTNGSSTGLVGVEYSISSDNDFKTALKVSDCFCSQSSWHTLHERKGITIRNNNHFFF